MGYNSLLFCRLRSRRLNQRRAQTQHLFLHLVVNLGHVHTVTILVDLATLIVVLALVLVGHLAVLVVV